MKNIFFFFLICISVLQMAAQTNDARIVPQPSSSLIVELGGIGAVGSVQFEQRFLSREHFSLHTRFGLGFYPSQGWSSVFLPLNVNAQIGKKRWRMEMGLGTTQEYVWHWAKYREEWEQAYGERPPNPKFDQLILHADLGVRWYPLPKLFFGANANPLIFYAGKNSKLHFLPWAGVMAGYAFR